MQLLVQLRRAAPPAALAALVILLVSGCSRGDDATTDDAVAGSGPDVTAPASNSAPAESAPPTTIGLPETSLTDCEDTPNPVDYPIDAMPRTFRPSALPTELVVNTIRTGTGHPAAAGDTVIVDYTGVRSATGELFDTSYLREVPLDFVLGRGGVISGWDQGLVGATAGSLIKLDVPTELAYGDAPPSDDIQPGDALTFMIEVRAVVPPVTAADAPLDLVVASSIGATELGVEDVTVGDGALVESGDTAIVHLLLVRGDNQVVLVNTWEQQDPLQIIVADGQSLPGVVTGIEGARVGGTRVLTIPPDLAFGPQGNPELGLPADTDLIVVAEVVGVY